ncbi:MAG: MetQ/NlpA family ABC transporter substrate-binding protein [Lachnospiraceae bacterium]|nr:MetQ/NlpA family ABC transporter substrate-binding protein [Lachnospiraceae bacterium]
MKKKTIAALGLALIATLGLTACGNADGQGSAEVQAAEDAGTATEQVEAPAEETKEEGADATESSSEEKTYDNVTVKLGIMGGSDETVWDPIVEEFAAKGVTIEYVFFTDYTQPNAALDAGDIDLNSFQHYTYLNKEKETFGYQIDAIGDTLITALNVYSDKLESIDDLPEGGKIAIPNDAVNGGRALNVLQAAGVIKLAEGKELTPTVADIEENAKNIEIIEVDASQTASLLPDVDAAVINGGYALDAGLSPIDDSIFFDDPSYYTTNAYVNVIAARTEDKDNELYQEIVKAYQTERTKEIYANDFQGLYIAAWE